MFIEDYRRQTAYKRDHGPAARYHRPDISHHMQEPVPLSELKLLFSRTEDFVLGTSYVRVRTCTYMPYGWLEASIVPPDKGSLKARPGFGVKFMNTMNRDINFLNFGKDHVGQNGPVLILWNGPCKVAQKLVVIGLSLQSMPFTPQKRCWEIVYWSRRRFL